MKLRRQAARRARLQQHHRRQYYLFNDRTQKVLRGPEESARRPDLRGARRRPARGGGRGPPGHDHRPGASGPTTCPRTRRTTATTSSTTTRRCGAPTSRTPSRTSTAAPAAPAQPIVTFDFTEQGPQEVAGRHARRSPSAARPACPPRAAAEAASASTSRSCSTTSSSSVPYIDYQREPGRHRRRATARRSRAASRSSQRPGPREPAQDRRAADQAQADLPVAGLGDARQAGAAPGPDRGHRRPRRRGALPAPLLPRARR